MTKVEDQEIEVDSLLFQGAIVCVEVLLNLDQQRLSSHFQILVELLFEWQLFKCTQIDQSAVWLLHIVDHFDV